MDDKISAFFCMKQIFVKSFHLKFNLPLIS